MNATTSPHDEQLDILLADYLARVDRGEAVNLPEFCAAHPELEAELREFMEMASMLEYLGQGAGAEGADLQLKSTADALHGQPTLAGVAGRPLVCDPLLAAAKKGAQGVQFGRYFLQELLGEGSMGAVHLAYDTALDRFVALKTPRFQGDQSSPAIERFRREARASAMVRHVNICPIFDVGTIDGVHFLSMAYIDGQSLAATLESGEEFSIPRSLHLIRKLAEALQEAHRHDVIHRDLKPANIMLDTSGEPIITDFGLARRLDMRETLLTQSGMLIGTLAYMSPEQLEGNADAIGRATDIYSLGVIFYQLLCGRLPYRGGFLSVVLQIRAGEAQSPAQYRAELKDYAGVEAVCLKMMAMKPEDRYQSMAEVVCAIAELQGEPMPPPLAAPLTNLTLSYPVPPCVPPPIARDESVAANVLSLVPKGFHGWAIHTLSSVAVVLLLAVLFAVVNAMSTPDLTVAKSDEPAGLAPPPQKAKEKAKETKPPPVAVPAEPRVSQKPALPPVPEVKKEPVAVPAAPTVALTPPPVKVPKVEAPAEVVAAVVPAADGPRERVIQSRRSASDKFGVVEIELTLPADGELEYRPDWACRVSSADGRVFYPAYRFEFAEDENEGKKLRRKIRKLTASFLSLGEKPLAVDLRYGHQSLLTRHDVPINVAAEEQRPLLTDWWASYTQPPREPLNDDARQIKTYLHNMLARRMQLPAAASLPTSEVDKSALQRYFEKSVGTFLGFASVQTALGEKSSFTPPKVEPLDQPIPQAPPIVSVQFPEPAAHVAIESIASQVPEDCIYLRCHSVANYLWFRDLLLGWGGGLNEIVSPRRLESPVRERLESQLALIADGEAHAKLQHSLSDLALVFGDSCFEDGAAVGVLFQAKNEQQVQAFILQQRERALAAFKESRAVEMQVMVGNEEVSLLTTSDKRLRSYYAVSGKHHFVTNSEYLVRRFFEASRGQRNLASLKEFRYARSKARLDTAQDVFFYMPDPFFQRIIRPEYQIEIARRQQAKADVQHLELARLAATGEGLAVTSVNQLLGRGFLPSAFSNRSDGSFATLVNGRAEDSLRGKPGTFLPICDLQITKATADEVSNYARFANHYRSQYRRMDPVAVVVSHQKAAGGREQVAVEVTVTPFALGTYATIQNILSEPQKSRIVGPADELLSLRASMRTSQQMRFLAFASVHDAKLNFQLVDGQLQVENLRPSESFAGTNWQLAMNRLEPECQETLIGLAGNMGAFSSVAGVANMVDVLVGGYANIVGSFLNLPVRLNRIEMPRINLPRASGPGYQLRSPRADLRDKELFRTEETADKHQVRFELKALQGTKIEPYIQAYTYLEARRASAQQAALLELTMQQLCLRADDVLPALEAIHFSKFLCPLAGQWKFTAAQAAGDPFPSQQWCSERWTASSLYDETAVPADYRFPFTDWLRDLNLGFSLQGQTLSADLLLEVSPRGEQPRPAAGK